MQEKWLNRKEFYAIRKFLAMETAVINNPWKLHAVNVSMPTAPRL